MAVKAPKVPTNGNGKATNRVADLTQQSPVSVDAKAIGRTGLRQWSGRIDEEFLKELKHDRKYPVYREMSENDPVVGAVLRAIEMLIRGVEWKVEPKDQTDDPQRELAEEIEKRFHGMRRSWAEVLVEILSFLPFGWSFHEVLYEAKPDGVYWADWPVRAQETLLKWEFAKDAQGKDTDTLVGMTQQPPTDATQRTIPLTKGLLFRLGARKNNPEGISIIRNAYLPWYYKNHLQRIEAIGIERDLAGYPVLYVPGEVLDTPGSQAYLAAQKIVTNIRRDEQEGALLSSAKDQNGNPLWELKLLSTGGTRAFNTNEIIQRYDQRIAMTCLADFVLLGHEKVGSFALASSKTDVFSLALAAILDTICGVINRDAIPRLAELNGWPVEDLPKLTHGDIERPDLQEIGAFITALSGAGVPLFPDMKLENRLRTMSGLPQLSPEEFDEREAVAAADKQAQMDAELEAAKAGAQSPGQQPDTPKPDAKPTEKGRWITTESGGHVYLEEGEDIGEALADGEAGPSDSGESAEGKGGGKPSGEQQDAATHYQQQGHTAINAALRRTGKPTGATRAATEHLDALVSGATLSKDMTLYRGMNAQPFAKLQPGAVITDRGFVSTSADERMARGFALGKEKGAIVRIHVPKGKRALHLGRVTGDNVEKEWLLPRGSRFRVTDIQRRAGQQAIVTMEAL